MSNPISDFLSFGYKKAVYGTIVLTCITPGILYLYLKDFLTFNSLGDIKIILFGVALASPLIVFNMAIAFLIVYLAFTMKKYQKGKRLTEEVLNRIIFMSSILSTSLSLNLAVIIFYLVADKSVIWYKILAFVFDIIIIIICIFVMKKKADLDLFYHDFPG